MVNDRKLWRSRQKKSLQHFQDLIYDWAWERTVPSTVVCVHKHSPSTEGRAVRDHVDSQRAVLSQDLNRSSQATRTCVSPKQKGQENDADKILVKDQSDWYKFGASSTAYLENFSASSASFTFRERWQMMSQRHERLKKVISKMMNWHKRPQQWT